MRKNTIITIISRKGSGKSVLMQGLAYANPKSAFIFDPTASLEPTDNRIFFDYEVDNFTKLVNRIGRKLYELKLEIVIQNCENPETILEIIYNHLSNIQVVIDEVDLSYSSGISNNTYLYKLCNFGRHKQIDLIGVARRPANTPRALTSQSDFIYLGNSNREPRDLSYLKDFLPPIVISKYENLTNYQFIAYNSIENSNSVVKLSNNALRILNIS